MKSIMHKKADRTCYLCMMLHCDYTRRTGLQEHHVIGGNPGRKLSERYGLKVYLCLQHHLYDGGSEAVHRNQKIRLELEKEGQRAFEKAYPYLEFKKIFGKNRLTEEDRQQENREKTEREMWIRENPLWILDNPLSPPDW